VSPADFADDFAMMTTAMTALGLIQVRASGSSGALQGKETAEDAFPRRREGNEECRRVYGKMSSMMTSHRITSVVRPLAVASKGWAREKKCTVCGCTLFSLGACRVFPRHFFSFLSPTLFFSCLFVEAGGCCVPAPTTANAFRLESSSTICALVRFVAGKPPSRTE